MVADQLVEMQIESGLELIERYVMDGGSVDLAFWLKPTDEECWFLHIVTDQVRNHGPRAAYHSIHKSLLELSKPWIRMTEIKLIGADDPVAIRVREVCDKYNTNLPMSCGNRHFQDLTDEHIYIYPKK